MNIENQSNQETNSRKETKETSLEPDNKDTVNVEVNEYSDIVASFAKSIDSITKVLSELSTGFSSMSEGRMMEVEVRTKSNKQFKVMSIFISLLLAVTIGTQIFYHQESANSRNASVTAASCVEPPAVFSPPGTPFEKLSCYERQEFDTINGLNELANYEYSVYMAERNNQPIPAPQIAFKH